MIGKFNWKNGNTESESENNAKDKGLRDDTAVSLVANTPSSYAIPQDAVLAGIDIATGSVEVYEDEQCTELVASVEAPAIQFVGFRHLETIYLVASTNTEVTPIIYKR